MKALSLFLILECTFYSPMANIVINEVSNACSPKVLVDENGNPQDWVELYNPMSIPENLATYYLTDDSANLTLWPLPAITINPGGFLLIYLSGQDYQVPGYIHAPIKLDRDGEMLMLVHTGFRDTVYCPRLEVDISFGRSPDGIFDIDKYLAMPTPGYANSPGASIPYNEIQFSHPSGFYNNEIDVTLASIGSSGSIWYALNGSTNNTVYDTALHLNATTVLRVTNAFSYFTGSLYRTYFINETGLGDLPIISVTLPPDSFDAVYNGSNYQTNYFPTRRAHLEYFGGDHILKFETDFDMELHGTTSTGLWPQKGLRVNCRKFYCNPTIHDTLFVRDKPWLDKFKGFNLRHDYGGGGMWNAHASMVASGLYADYLSFQPCHVFINAQYWGEYHLTEHGNDDYIANNHSGVNKDSIELLRQNYNWANFTNDLIALKGSTTTFFEDFNTLSTLPPTSPGFHSYFTSRFAFKSYFDYFINEIYVGNTDWLGIDGAPINNVKLWREKPNGKWHYILYDCDYAIGIQTPSTDVLSSLLTSSGINYNGILFSRAMQHPSLRTFFINRFADLLNTRLLPDSTASLVHGYKAMLDSSIYRQLQRWSPSISVQDWNNNLQMYFLSQAAQRQSNIRDHIQTNFVLNEQVNLTFEVYPSNGGVVRLNTISPQAYPWSGVYYDGAPVTIMPEANQGFVFSHWESSQLGMHNTADSITWNADSSQTIRLYFEEASSIPEEQWQAPSVYPNPFQRQLYVVSENGIFIQLFDASGRKLFEKVSNEKVVDLSEWASQLSSGFYSLKVEHENGRVTSLPILKCIH